MTNFTVAIFCCQYFYFEKVAVVEMLLKVIYVLFQGTG